ncbi:phosphoketolase family protein [Shewanella insulae]|uniref:Phosphoketolase n=1 Tax=Shewanella insulae TaxID=2681496 RepID=A0A6L7HUT1_9GAMM|nr:phosphoketolase family protein [Shewanella insulae]MCG9711334.1 phosphoketolase family protein [Shewanella insulae]MCG9739474.1 phosphoketolase family protein [Shewanella insulae]MCG9753758.1 phosphoketolase family protein [Shewanella insulae]MXR68079.1 phosphoketolase [Shewanella insulae]
MSQQQEITALKKFVRATNFLATSQIYLKQNVLHKRPLEHSDIKPRLLGHWGTCPGINFVYANVNRLIKKTNRPFLYLVGPGHGFPAVQANLFMEGSLSHFYPETIPYNETGIEDICKKFSAAYGYPSHANPEAPGQILEGGELGYSLSVAWGAVLDNPDLIATVLIGDGESETGPLAASWYANRLVSPANNGAVLPIVHINGYKISGPTRMGRMSHEELELEFKGLGYHPIIVDSDLEEDVYVQMTKAMDESYAMIEAIQTKARNGEDIVKPRWPVILMRTAKGWTGVAEDNGKKLEGNCDSHQVIVNKCAKDKQHLDALDQWLASYKFNELYSINEQNQIVFDKDIQSLLPPKELCCGRQHLSYGGEVVRSLNNPKLEDLAYGAETPRGQRGYSMLKMGQWMRDAFKLNRDQRNLRIFSPDETYSNQLQAVFEETDRAWQWPIESWDEDMSRDGRVLELLSENLLFGMLHGYTVTGRHGMFPTYESFSQVVSSMADQYCKYVYASQGVHFRKPVPSCNVVLSSLLERQDHNGYSHQNPSFLGAMLEKHPEIISAYLPADANTTLVYTERAFADRDKLNIIAAGKKELPQWLTLDEARQQAKDGVMVWDFASDENPDVVLAGCGDYVTQECMASLVILRELLPRVRVRFVSVTELSSSGLGSRKFQSKPWMMDEIFTADKGVVFNYHGYPNTIKKLVFDYKGSHRFRIKGYEEEGSTTTPFDMGVRNGTSRYHLVIDMAYKLFQQGVIDETQHVAITTDMLQRLVDHRNYIKANGVDPENIENWVWTR